MWLAGVFETQCRHNSKARQAKVANRLFPS
jgi:hypothetical protein